MPRRNVFPAPDYFHNLKPSRLFEGNGQGQQQLHQHNMMLRPRIARIGLSFVAPRRAFHITLRRRNGINQVPPRGGDHSRYSEAISNDLGENDFMNDTRRNAGLGMDTLDRTPQADFENDIQQGLHVVPLLGEDFTDGIPDFLSPAAFDMAWTQYQSLMVEKLNILTGGMSRSFDVNSKNLEAYCSSSQLQCLCIAFY